jgi:hypothetical protein
VCNVLDPVIRETVLASLDPVLDVYLAQPENIRSLFSALNDEMFEIREKAIAIFGRLSVRNPAYIMPSMRKILIQLLTELGTCTHTHTYTLTLSLSLSLEIVTFSIIVSPFVCLFVGDQKSSLVIVSTKRKQPSC